MMWLNVVIILWTRFWYVYAVEENVINCIVFIMFEHKKNRI